MSKCLFVACVATKLVRRFAFQEASNGRSTARLVQLRWSSILGKARLRFWNTWPKTSVGVEAAAVATAAGKITTADITAVAEAGVAAEEAVAVVVAARMVRPPIARTGKTWTCRTMAKLCLS